MNKNRTQDEVEAAAALQIIAKSESPLPPYNRKDSMVQGVDTHLIHNDEVDQMDIDIWKSNWVDTILWWIWGWILRNIIITTIKTMPTTLTRRWRYRLQWSRRHLMRNAVWTWFFKNQWIIVRRKPPMMKKSKQKENLEPQQRNYF